MKGGKEREHNHTEKLCQCRPFRRASQKRKMGSTNKKKDYPAKEKVDISSP